MANSGFLFFSFLCKPLCCREGKTISVFLTTCCGTQQLRISFHLYGNTTCSYPPFLVVLSFWANGVVNLSDLVHTNTSLSIQFCKSNPPEFRVIVG
ncbi:Galactinol--sucrose galactosyltransferase [Psidium guajava]|nr:Galactinol--sucrose galactosyltransferase [Psidium guajava]